MTANMIIRFFEVYGWIMTLLATTGIVFVGCLKAIGIFYKLKTNVKKYVYFITACIISIISCTVYLCISNAFVWSDWGVTVVFIIAYTMALYALYENTGIRALLKKLLFSPVKTALHKIEMLVFSKSLSQEESVNIAKGLGKDILSQLIAELTNCDNEENNKNASIEISTDDKIQKIKAPSINKYQQSNFFS